MTRAPGSAAAGRAFQAGGFVIGMVVGLLIGLALALAVALYITKAPVPFIDKVPQRTAEQDNAEAERNRNWDPNAALAGRPPVRAPAAVLPPPVAAAADGAASAPLPSAVQPPSARDPATILSGRLPPQSTAAEPEAFYFVQVGAYTRSEDAEQQRAKLALVGYTARVSEREQSGRTVYRVRVGPYDARDDADAALARLTESGVEARIIRVEKS